MTNPTFRDQARSRRLESPGLWFLFFGRLEDFLFGESDKVMQKKKSLTQNTTGSWNVFFRWKLLEKFSAKFLKGRDGVDGWGSGVTLGSSHVVFCSSPTAKSDCDWRPICAAGFFLHPNVTWVCVFCFCKNIFGWKMRKINGSGGFFLERDGQWDQGEGNLRLGRDPRSWGLFERKRQTNFWVPGKPSVPFF